MADFDQFDSIGGYERIALIGRGGMGEVWLVVERATMKAAALKILLPQFSSSPTYRDMYFDEVTIASQLGGKDGFVGVRAFGEDQGLLFFAMDLVDGVNLHRLRRVLRKQGEVLSVPMVIHIMRVVLRALRAAHGLRIAQRAAGVVHGDVKPANILVASNGSVWITDLGIARFTPEEGEVTSRPMGTLRYMAPEVYEGLICPQNDLYSAGATMHELLSGEPMIPKGGSPAEIRKRIREGSIPRLQREVPASVERLLSGLLDKSIDKRIQTANDALEQLKRIERELGVGDLQDELAAVYRDTIGAPRSGLTLFLQNLGAHEAEMGSFLPDYIRKAATSGRDEDAAPAAPTVDPTDDDGVPEPQNREVSAPWMLEDDGVPEPRNREVSAPWMLEDDGVPEPRNREVSAPWMVEDDCGDEPSATERENDAPRGPIVDKTAVLPLAELLPPAALARRATEVSRAAAPVPSRPPASPPDPPAQPLVAQPTVASRQPQQPQPWVAPAQTPVPRAPAPARSVADVQHRGTPPTGYPPVAADLDQTAPALSVTTPTQRERRTVRQLSIFGGLLAAAGIASGAYLMWPRKQAAPVAEPPALQQTRSEPTPPPADPPLEIPVPAQAEEPALPEAPEDAPAPELKPPVEPDEPPTPDPEQQADEQADEPEAPRPTAPSRRSRKRRPHRV